MPTHDLLYREGYAKQRSEPYLWRCSPPRLLRFTWRAVMYFCWETKDYRHLPNFLLLFLQRMRYSFMTSGGATLVVTFVPVKPFLAHLLLNMDLAWEFGLTPLSFLLRRKLWKSCSRLGRVEALFFKKKKAISCYCHTAVNCCDYNIS